MNPYVEAILFLLRQAELSSDPSVHADAKRLAAQVRIVVGLSRQATPNPEPPGSEVEPADEKDED